MFIRDGSSEDYTGDMRQYGFPLFRNLYSWGWIGSSIPSKGWKSEQLKSQVVQKLKSQSDAHAVDHYCGDHSCEVCIAQGKDWKESHMFEASIKIAHNNKVYCCPRGVEHYIEAHDYKPSDEVIDAVLNGHWYTEDELLEMGKKDPDVQRTIVEVRERNAKATEEMIIAKQKEEDEMKILIGVKREDMKKNIRTLPEFQKALTNIFMDNWRFSK